MGVIRVDNFIDAYRIRAGNADLHAMAARRIEATEFVSNYIVRGLELEADDTLVDIGCGDGCLLKMAQGMVLKATGIVATIEEKRRLDPLLSGVTVLQGLCHQLPLPDESASKIVCNGVLIYLSSTKEVRAALEEMARVARPGARIWVGEIPVIDEFAEFRIYAGNSVLGLLRHTVTVGGPRAFLGMLRRLMMSAIGRDQIVLNSARLFHTTPEEFLALADGCGLKLEKCAKHQEIDRAGNAAASPFRYDYMFWK